MGLIFTYLLAYGGSCVALLRPYVGFLIYVAFSILKPESLWPWVVPVGNYSRILGYALIIGWVLKGFGSWRLGRARAIVAAYIGFWVWSFMSACGAVNSDLAWNFVQEQSKILIPFLVGITMINSTRQIKQLAWVILICQSYLAVEFNLTYFREGINRVAEVGFGGVEEGCVSIAMVIGTGFALHLGLSVQRASVRAALLLCSVLMVHFAFFSMSRGGMLGLIALVGLSFVLMQKQAKHYLLLIVVVIVCLRLAGKEVREEFMTIFASKESRDGSAQSRLDLWVACVQVIAKVPMFGVGPDCFPMVSHEYGFARGKEAHNLWVQLGAEIGVPGTAFHFLTFAICCWRVWPIARGKIEGLDPWYPHAARLIITSLSGYVVSAQFISLEGLETPYYVVLIGAGMLKLMSAPQLDMATPDDPWMSRAIASAAATADAPVEDTLPTSGSPTTA